MSSDCPGALSSCKYAEKVTTTNRISRTERINPMVPGTMPFLSLLLETTIPTIDSGSDIKGNISNKSIKISNAPFSCLYRFSNTRTHKKNKPGTATETIRPAMASLLVFLSLLLILFIPIVVLSDYLPV